MPASGHLKRVRPAGGTSDDVGVLGGLQAHVAADQLELPDRVHTRIIEQMFPLSIDPAGCRPARRLGPAAAATAPPAARPSAPPTPPAPGWRRPPGRTLSSPPWPCPSGP